MKRPIKVVKLPPKIQAMRDRKAFEAKCDDLCNRLQADFPKNITTAVSLLGLSGGISDNAILTAIGERAHLSIYTSMGSKNLFVADCRKQVGTGYLAAISPPKYGIKSSPSLIVAATIAYIQLCKAIGEFQ
jgi:hypothetical protein